MAKRSEKYSDFFEFAKKSMPAESIARATQKAHKTILKIKLAKLREKQEKETLMAAEEVG